MYQSYLVRICLQAGEMCSCHKVPGDRQYNQTAFVFKRDHVCFVSLPALCPGLPYFFAFHGRSRPWDVPQHFFSTEVDCLWALVESVTAWVAYTTCHAS